MSILAINGGRPLRNTPLPAGNTMGEEERANVLKVLDSGVLSGFVANPGDEFLGGPFVRQFEQAFNDRFGTKHAISVNSATSGLHAAVIAAGVVDGDEVIIPPYTMSATATSVIMSGGRPVFVDISDDDFCISVDQVKARITDKTKAVIAVNLFGQPARLYDLRSLCDNNDILLIEDNAQAPGTTCQGNYAGTIGHMGVFSLNRHKVIQCGEGGVVVTNDGEMADKLRLVRNHGEVLARYYKYHGVNNIVGQNYRLTELQAAVAIPQLKKLDQLVEPRRAIAGRLNDRLDYLSGLTAPAITEGNTHAYYLYAIKYDSEKVGVERNTFASALRAEGYPVAEGYVEPIYWAPLFKERFDYKEGLCPITEELYARRLLTTNICRFPLTVKEADGFADACEKIFDNLNELEGGSA